MGTVFGSIREKVKHALAMVLFTILLLGMIGAILGIFSAGISLLTNHGAAAGASAISTTTSAVPATSQNQGTTSQGSADSQQSGTVATSSKSQSAAGGVPSNTQQSATGQVQSQTQTQSGASSSPPLAGTDLASRLDEQMRNMQSPVTGQLDAGGVALGNQVQNAFGHFLSGLIETLFVEQQNGTTVSAPGN